MGAAAQYARPLVGALVPVALLLFGAAPAAAADIFVRGHPEHRAGRFTRRHPGQLPCQHRPGDRHVRRLRHGDAAAAGWRAHRGGRGAGAPPSPAMYSVSSTAPTA